ncbi:hypothetical protein BDM02DRAFT_3190917 [Thelephora ganbajun]|uniref:Uncharacterized protein n=1 Tax=Thelephora ganbajun TaxID=370292 RepID=A0ACB6Z3I3_THEGA|nr:hypothetical protein BDM02DRAFT_3190917 [Thelephora ganbajun]
MSAFTNRPFSRLWHGKSRSDTHPHSSDFVGDAAPPFAELASGLDPIPAAEELARIRYYNSKMAIRDTEFVDMDLTHGRRRLICAGRLFRTDSTFEWKGMYELFVLLFDNYLVVTQITGTGSDTAFQVYKRPIPLDLLRVEIRAAPPNRKGTIGGRDDSTVFPPETWGITPPPGDPRAMHPLIIHHDARLGGTTRLFAESEDVRSTWKSKLEEAVLLRQKSSQVFEMSVVAREEFLTTGGRNPNTYPPESRPTTRTITCATPFGKRIVQFAAVYLIASCAAPVTRDGRTLLAIGCAEGLWIGNWKDLQSFHWVLRLPIQQCLVLGEYGLILTLSNGELHVFDLEECVPKSTGRAITFRPKILEIKGKVHFFRAGKLNGEMYIVAAVKKHLDTVFYVWEAAMTMGPDGPLPDPQEFQLIRNFFLPVECNDAIFLRTKLCILHNDGFSLVKPSEYDLSLFLLFDSELSP